MTCVAGRVAAGVCVMAAAAGCGGSSGPKVAGGLCTLKAIDAVASAFGVAATHVTDARGTGNNGSPQCVYKTRTTGGRRVELIANVEVTQGSYFIVERTIDEASQIFGTPRREPAPVSVTNLGLEASWFPQWQWLISTDGSRVVTLTVDLGGATQARKIAIGRRVSLVYLHTPHGKQASAVSKTFP